MESESVAVRALAEALKVATGTERGATYHARSAKGAPQELKAAKVRGRYERLASCAIELGAETVVIQDAAGAVIGVVSVEQTEEEDAAPAVSKLFEKSEKLELSPKTAESEAVRAMVRVVLEAQDKAIQRQAEMMSQVMHSALAVMKTASERTSVLERALMQSLTSRERELAEGLSVLAAQSAEVAQDKSDAAAKESDEMASDLMKQVLMPAMAAKALKVVGG